MWISDYDRGTPVRSGYYKTILFRGMAPLQARFATWEDILASRDARAPRDHVVRFVFVETQVRFSLDALSPNEIELFDEYSEKLCEKLFFLDRHDHDFTFHYIFFRPKNGVYKDTRFRFSIAQEDATIGNEIGPVTLAFVRLLLAGGCDFSDMTFLQYVGSNSQLLRGTFPQLPLQELLPRADSHEFIRIDFDQTSCEAIGSASSNVKKLGFTGCKFADGGRGVAQALATSQALTSLEWETLQNENSTVSDNALSPLLKTNNFNLKSLTLTMSDLGSSSATRHLSGCMPLETLLIADRGYPFEQHDWEGFLTRQVKNHPTLKTLILGEVEVEFLILVLNMVKCRTISSLESVVPSSATKYLVDDAQQKIFDQINAVLNERAQSKALQQSSYRHALLPRALDASKIASRPDFALAILKENADVINTY